MLEANEMKVLRKIVGKRKLEANKSENLAVSNILMSGWRDEEENGTNM